MASFKLLKLALPSPATEPLHVQSPLIKKLFSQGHLLPPISWAISSSSPSELRSSSPSELFPASHHRQTKPDPSEFTGLSSQLGNAHVFLPPST